MSATTIGQGLVAKGLEGVEVDETSISLVDGERGELSYRGVNIDELVELTFDEVAALVATGTADPGFTARLAACAELSPREAALILSLPRDLHPMHLLQGVTPLLDRSDAFADFGDAAQGFAIAAKLPAIIACPPGLNPDKPTIWGGSRPSAFASAADSAAYPLAGVIEL